MQAVIIYITLPKLYSLFGFKRVSLLGAGRNWSFSILDVIRITFEMNLWMQKQIRKNAPTTPVYNRQLATFAQITFSLHLTFFPSFEMANHFKGFRPDQMKRVRYHLHLFFFRNQGNGELCTTGSPKNIEKLRLGV